MEEVFLVRRGTPAAVDEELDPVVRGIGGRLAQGTEETGSRLATPGTPSSKTVVPSGTAPSASPSARGCSLRRTSLGGASVEEKEAGSW